MTPTAGLCPFSLAGIEREELEFPNGYKTYRWCLPFNWPEGSIKFEASDFTKIIVGKPRLLTEQIISFQERGRYENPRI